LQPSGHHLPLHVDEPSLRQRGLVSLRFGVWGLGLRVWVSGFYGFGFRVQRSGFRVWGLGFRV